MKKSKRNKAQKRQQVLQRRRQQTSTRRPLSQIPPESADQVAMTTTGEILQLIRLHYRVTAMTVSNRLLSTAEAASLGSLDQYFDHAEVVVKDPAALLRTLEDMASSIPDVHERLAVVAQYMEDKAKQPVPAMERFPLEYDEEGIQAVEALLAPHQVLAMHHWQGHTEYTRHDLVRDMLRQGDIPTGHPSMVVQEKPSGETPLTTQLCAFMRSEAYEDWWRAWELLRDHTPDHITTFDALETLFHLDVYDCSVNNMLYDLDMALQNAGVNDLRWMAKRVEVARWVYTHFPEESALNLGNFRGYEAESLWEMGHKEQAEALLQALTTTFPTFAWGYIWWGDGYWMSDWSYEYAPDYDRAAAIYRQALAQPDLEDRGDVHDRLDDLADERAHPEKRARIQQTRLQHIQRRKSRNETT